VPEVAFASGKPTPRVSHAAHSAIERERVFHRSVAIRSDAFSSQPASTRALWPAAAVIVSLWVIVASQWLLSGTVVPWDAKNQSYAFFRFLATALHSGSSPFWNPYHYGGHPSVADPQSLIFAPPFLAWAWFDATPSMSVFDVIVFGHLLTGGLALGMVGWRMGWSMPAITLAAAVFMLGGPASGRLAHTGMIISYALFPLALLLMLVALERRSTLTAGAFAVVAAIIVLQRNHVALLLSFVLAALFLGELSAARDRRSWLRERAAVITTMGGIGFVLIAGPMLLTLQFAALSNRPEIELHEALPASLHPVALANMAVANVMGSLERAYAYWGPSNLTVPEVGATDRAVNYVFVGATTTLVLMWFGVAGGGLAQRGRRLLTCTLVVALLYTLGRYTPLYGLAFAYVPGIHFFRRPSDGIFVVLALLSLLIGHLLTDYERFGLTRVTTSRAVPAGATTLAVLGWAVMFSHKTGHAWDALIEVFKAALIAVAAAASLQWASRRPDRRRLTSACVALLAAGELVFWNTASSLNAESRERYAVLEQPQGHEARALAILEREIAERQQEGERPRIEVVGVGGPWQNLAAVRGLEATNGYNPLRIGRYDRLVSPGETTHALGQRRFPTSFPGYDCALARELGLEYIVLGKPIEQMPHLARRPVAKVLVGGPKIWIYRLAHAEPRVEFMTRVLVANVDPAVQAGRFAVNPTTALIDDETVPQRTYLPMLRNGPQPRAKLVAWTPDTVEVRVESAYPGVLVLHDAYYPGWTAMVDGRPAPILRTNILFRGVELENGRHTVVFRYAPFSFENLWHVVIGFLAAHS
jgi:hypothetical protein